jgi:Kef-type K+ transport system membrane component KefB
MPHKLLELSLPLSNPVLLFSLILFIILFAPILFNKLKIPHLIGLIIAGAIIGPNGLNLMLRDSSITLFGTVGLLYIMFLAGLEIDLGEFKRNSTKSIIFGLYTFLIPMTLGTITGYYLLEFSMQTSVLLASMFASHTLLAYPILGKFGVTKNRAVTVAVGGTMITDTLALLVLAVIVGMTTGTVDENFWIQLTVSFIVFALIVMIGFPILGRWFFKNYTDNISQYIFVLGLVFLAAFLAEAAGVEAIIGAFLAGLALNRLIPHTSALMNRIEFAGNALFIPFFLIGVGMLVDFRAFIKDFDTIIVAVTMTLIAILGKFSAAWLAQKTFKYSLDERRLIFGLSNAQASATLAAVLVGYNIILGYDSSGEPVRLLNDSVLNGSILMILVTSTIASLSTQKGAQNIALSELTESDTKLSTLDESILIPMNNIENANELINLSVTIKSKKSITPLYGLNVIANSLTDESAEIRAQKILEKAAICAASTDSVFKQILRYDLDIVNGITNVVKEKKITDLIIGLHKQTGLTHSFLGELTEEILKSCNTTTLICNFVQPLNTIKRHLIVIPRNAEKEIGFPFWLIKVWNIARNTGSKLVFYAHEVTLNYIRNINKSHPISSEFITMNDWRNFPIITGDLKFDDNMIIVFSRKNGISYNSQMNKIPEYLNELSNKNSFILVYPKQAVFIDSTEDTFISTSVSVPLKDYDEISTTITKLFRKR